MLVILKSENGVMVTDRVTHVNTLEGIITVETDNEDVIGYPKPFKGSLSVFDTNGDVIFATEYGAELDD